MPGAQTWGINHHTCSISSSLRSVFSILLKSYQLPGSPSKMPGQLTRYPCSVILRFSGGSLELECGPGRSSPQLRNALQTRGNQDCGRHIISTNCFVCFEDTQELPSRWLKKGGYAFNATDLILRETQCSGLRGMVRKTSHVLN
jgi:hypothetical protein